MESELEASALAHGGTREQAIGRVLVALRAFAIVGVETNIPLLKQILTDSVFVDGQYDTDYLPGLLRRIDSDQLIAEINAGAGDATGGIDKDAILIDDSDELKVLSPATAIFYATPTPTEPPYVTVGDRVQMATTLGQLEAMKLFTPLSLADFNTEFELYDASREYEVTRINMATGQQVNVGDLLFVVKPV